MKRTYNKCGFIKDFYYGKWGTSKNGIRFGLLNILYFENLETIIQNNNSFFKEKKIEVLLTIFILWEINSCL